MRPTKPLTHKQYADLLDMLRNVRSVVAAGAGRGTIEEFAELVSKTFGRDVSDSQIEGCMSDNDISHRSCFQPRIGHGSNPTKKISEQHMDRILDRINALQHDIRLLQTHTVEIIRRLPPKTAISPTQTLFSEEQPIE
jgi:hypothetical protein